MNRLRASDRDASLTTADPVRESNYTIARRSRFWEVRAPSGELVCLTVYKRGAKEVIRRLEVT